MADNLPGGGLLKKGANLKKELMGKLPTGKLKEVSKKPEEACQQYNEWIAKARKYVEKAQSKAKSVPFADKVIPVVSLDENNVCVQETKQDTFPICENLNKARVEVETTLAKSAILMFENGQCKSAVDALKKKVMDKAQENLPSTATVGKAVLQEGPEKACSWYGQMLGNMTQKYTEFESKLNGFITGTKVYKLVEKYSAEHAKKLLPSLGLQIKDNSCQSTPDDNAISAEFTPSKNSSCARSSTISWTKCRRS